MDGLENSGEPDGARTRETISGIDQRIEDLLTNSPGPNQHIHSTKLIELRRRRNALVPFYQLPIELLLAIVERCLKRNRVYGGYYTCLLQLSFVSTFLKNVVQGRSELWAHIVAGLPIPGVEACLVRSLNQPLYLNLDGIKYSIKGDGMPRDTSDWARAVEARRAYENAYVDRVLPHVSRVRVASLKMASETYVLLQTMLTSPAVFLEELKVEAVDRGPFPVPATPPVEAFGGHAPRLRRLDIGRGFHFLLSSFKFSGLSVLSICSEATLVVDKIIEMLPESPGLSSLTIIERRTARGIDPSLTNGRSNNTDHNRNSRHTILPKLRELTLRLEGADRVLYLLEHVQATSYSATSLQTAPRSLSDSGNKAFDWTAAYPRSSLDFIDSPLLPPYSSMVPRPAKTGYSS
ncbi:hypothetical protein FRC04_006028 [Tulasnella sp. 424]|nr:hypothetical protein FRC04_006028 [Tulasnella sp. 424]